jgi:hypothetical protein
MIRTIAAVPANARENPMSFKEKLSLASLLGVAVICGVYAFGLRHGIPKNLIVANVGLVFAWILATAVMILSFIVLIVVVGVKEASRPSDERDRLVKLASKRNANWVGVFGLWFVMYLAMAATPYPIIAWAALGLFMLSQIVMYGSELYYYRRGI